MNPVKRTYAEVLKTPFPTLNPRLTAEPLIAKPTRVRLSKKAKANLRAIIHDKPISPLTGAKDESVIYTNESAQPTQVVNTQPLMLATVSDWVMSGYDMNRSIYSVKKEEKSMSSVQLLKPDMIGEVVREGRAENPIDICDDSDEGELSCNEVLTEVKKESIDGYRLENIATMSDFDLDIVISNSVDIFGPLSNKVGNIEEDVKKQPELGVSLRLHTSDELRRAKRRMEYCFMDDYSLKMKSFKRLDRPEYEGEYTFIVRIAVDDSNTVEIKDAVTTCKLRKIEDESEDSEDEYKPDTEVESVSDVDEKRRRLNREALLFDPVVQNTKYNRKATPNKIPIIKINEKPSETAEYH